MFQILLFWEVEEFLSSSILGGFGYCFEKSSEAGSSVESDVNHLTSKGEARKEYLGLQSKSDFS